MPTAGKCAKWGPRMAKIVNLGSLSIFWGPFWAIFFKLPAASNLHILLQFVFIFNPGPIFHYIQKRNKHLNISLLAGDPSSEGGVPQRCDILRAQGTNSFLPQYPTGKIGDWGEGTEFHVLNFYVPYVRPTYICQAI